MYNYIKNRGDILSGEIKKIALASILTSLSTVFIILGGFIDILDMTVAAICSLIIVISQIEIKGKYPFLIYITSSVLALIFMPLTTASLYYIAFFGYYPLIRLKTCCINKYISKTIHFVIFNVAMAAIMIMFKTLFALHNEPIYMYVILLVVSNVFFLCFDRILDVLAYVYIKKIRKNIKLFR